MLKNRKNPCLLSISSLMMTIKIMTMLIINYFCAMVDRRKVFTPDFQPGPLSENITIANVRHSASRVRTCAESELTDFIEWSSAVVITTTPQHHNQWVENPLKWMIKSRRSRPNVFCKKEVLKNFAKSTGKHMHWNLFLIELKVSGVFMWIFQNF